MYAGLNCQGPGTVTVSLHGSTYRIACIEALSRHVEKSTGDPFASFLPSVDATPGVRWTLVLARESLDGS